MKKETNIPSHFPQIPVWEFTIPNVFFIPPCPLSHRLWPKKMTFRMVIVCYFGTFHDSKFFDLLRRGFLKESHFEGMQRIREEKETSLPKSILFGHVHHLITLCSTENTLEQPYIVPNNFSAASTHFIKAIYIRSLCINNMNNTNNKISMK